ncbi:Bug family tripartite tricarboxylate transporter substrate binding protein [Variovorax boronicumulans]
MKTLLLAILGFFLSDASIAQKPAYPNRPIRILITTAAGGGSDTLGRLLAQKLANLLKTPVVADNRPGAGGVIATKELLRSPADGYSLLLATSSTHGINPWVYRDLGYDVTKDFKAVAILATTDYALAVPANSQIADVEGLVAAGKAQKLDFGSSGNGTTTHLAGALFGSQAAAPFVHIPYKSAVNSLNGLLAGEVSFMFENTSLFAPFVQSEKVRILATTGSKRSLISGSAPTMIESGLPGFEIVGWFALVCPVQTPDAIVELLNNEVTKILAMQDVKQRLASLGYEPVRGSSAQADSFVAAQYAGFGSMVRRARIKVE